MSKSEAGEWQRKKGPAPPRPVPQKRALKKMPMRLVQQELQDIEIKQTELERQGVLLETAIRKRTESTSNNPQDEVANAPNSGPNSIEVEDMILQLFELVNEKNELFRRQTELMYLWVCPGTFLFIGYVFEYINLFNWFVFWQLDKESEIIFGILLLNAESGNTSMTMI